MAIEYSRDQKFKAEGGQKKPYIALHGIRHDGKGFVKGDEIYLGEKAAKRLLGMKAIKPKPVEERAAAEGADDSKNS